MAKRAADDPVTRYAREVVDGRTVAGRLVRLACERHLRDLNTGIMRGLKWDPKAAQHAIDFFRFLRHSEGEWAGTVVRLEPWQQFRIGSVFGWMRRYGQCPHCERWSPALGGEMTCPTCQRRGEQMPVKPITIGHFRRFRTAYNEVARKNGKTTESAGVGLYLFDAEDEPGAQVYSAATMRDQARISWGSAARMVKKSSALKKRIGILGDGPKSVRCNMSVLETASKFEPLGADADNLDGLNVHGAIIDELHAHKNRAMWDVLETATGSRRQPLLWAITTAGFDQTGICFEIRTYSVDVLEGRLEDDTWFAYIATLDEGDDPFDEANWPKANPNLGVSKDWEDMRRLAAKARVLPTALNNFLTKHLNVWTNQAVRWIPPDLWDANAGPVGWTSMEEHLRGRTAYGGLDLSSVSDLSGWVMVFPDEDDMESVNVLARFWCPRARLTADDNRYRDHYQAWEREGLLTVTPGNAVDYEFIKAQVLRDAEMFDLVDLNVDRLFQAHQISMQLAEEMGENRVFGMGQGWRSMTAPCNELERRLLLKKVHHGGNKLLRWMAGNVSLKVGPADDKKPDKQTSQGKIDGIVALLMALERAMRHTNEPSVYEDRGVITG